MRSPRCRLIRGRPGSVRNGCHGWVVGVGVSLADAVSVAITLRDVTQGSAGCRVQRVVLPGVGKVLGADHRPVGPAEEYLEFLRVQAVSPNTVKSYARGLALWWKYLTEFGSVS